MGKPSMERRREGKVPERNRKEKERESITARALGKLKGKSVKEK